MSDSHKVELGQIRSLETKLPNLTGFKEGFVQKEKILVIGYDKYEVLYDVWSEFNKKWKLGSRRTVTFYHIEMERLLMSSVVSDEETIGEIELSKYFPEVPLRIYRHVGLEWCQESFSTLKKYVDHLKNRNVDVDRISDQDSLELKVCYLDPQGPKGGEKKPQKIVAENGSNISPLELLWKANNVQSKWKIDGVNGVGIYRSGLNQSIPSYVIGGAYSVTGMKPEWRYPEPVKIGAGGVE